MKKFLSLVLALTLTLSLCVIPAHAEDPAVSITLNESSATLFVGADEDDAKLTLEATPEDGVVWSSSKDSVAVVTQNGVVTAKSAGTATITASMGLVGEERISATCQITVKDRYEIKLANSARNVTVTVGNSATLKAPTLYDNKETEEIKSNVSVKYFLSKNEDNAVTFDEETGKVTANKKGEAEVKATVTYTDTDANENKFEGTVTYTIKVEAPKLAITLGEVTNGGDGSWTSKQLKQKFAQALDNAIDYSGNKEVTSITVVSNKEVGGKLYDGKNAIDNEDDLTESDVDFRATAGYIGDVEFDVKVEIDGETYDGTLTIPVVAYEEGFTLSVSGVESGSKVTFDFPDDYDYWYVCEGSRKNSMFNGLWGRLNAPSNGANWSVRYEAGETYSLNSSKFDDGSVTLYVVGIAEDEDDKGVASTGELEVVLDSYDIEYSGVAGETITFDQDDFEDMLQEAAEDAGLIGRNSTASVEFDHVTFKIPGTKEGVLYNGSSKISKTTTECTNLDKVTFEIASKADSQVCIEFTVTADYYKDNKPSTEAKPKYFSGRVVVNVVHEDIKYTVPVDGSVVFKAEDFQDFFDDTYKTGTLSYVKFTELPKVTDGALYATYSAIYAGTVAEESDKFYYDSKKVSDYDLDDVTFRTSLWSKAGTKVYIPFTAYGTKSYQSVDGWVVITVENARTMNFTDVKTGDWFYNNVKNAYSMGLIEGKTTTTFNPNDNMTYAEAVTLAARMNQLYYSGKVTLSNSTTGNWYSSYESYAISKGIISSALGNKANLKITRKDYVDIFYNALPASAYTARNTVSKIPDLANNTANAKVYAFYRAGILTGYANTPGKTNGAFGPNDNIKRSEVATILIRMMDSGTRVYFTL